MCFCGPDMGPQYVRRELMRTFCLRASWWARKGTSAERHWSCDGRWGWGESVRDYVGRGIANIEGIVFRYSQWIVLWLEMTNEFLLYNCDPWSHGMCPKFYPRSIPQRFELAVEGILYYCILCILLSQYNSC